MICKRFYSKAINRDNGYHRTNYKNGDWVYGLITRLFDDRFPNLPAEMTDLNGVSGIEIDHNTICQYIGRTDKNDNKIFKHDVVRDTEEDMTMVVRWDDEELRFVLDDYGYTGCVMGYAFDTYGFNDFCKTVDKFVEVIGNIYDSPELLEGGGEDED